MPQDMVCGGFQIGLAFSGVVVVGMIYLGIRDVVAAIKKDRNKG